MMSLRQLWRGLSETAGWAGLQTVSPATPKAVLAKANAGPRGCPTSKQHGAQRRGDCELIELLAIVGSVARKLEQTNICDELIDASLFHRVQNRNNHHQ
jgi:hypothetical protein